MPLPPTRFTNVVGTPATPKFARIILRGQVVESNVTNRPCYNIFDFYCVSPAAGGSEAALWASFWTGAMAALWPAAFSDSYSVVDSLTQFFDDPVNAGTVTPLAVVGGVATDRSASFNATVIRRLSGLAGRNFRGSIHLGAVPETFTTKDHINATGHTAYDPIVTQLNTFVTTPPNDGVNNFSPVILSPTLSDFTANPRIISGSYVNNWVINERLGTMKRRKERT